MTPWSWESCAPSGTGYAAGGRSRLRRADVVHTLLLGATGEVDDGDVRAGDAGEHDGPPGEAGDLGAVAGGGDVGGGGGQDALTGHEVAVGVDAQRRAGDEGDEVVAVFGQERLGLVGKDGLGALDAVGEYLAEDLDGEGVADLDLVQVVEESGLGQAAVGGEHGVLGHAADGQGGALQVADALGEHGVGGAVVDREVDVDGGDAQAGHDAGVIGAQELLVV